MTTLITAHNFAAARELLADLRGISALAPYVYENLYLESAQDSAIATATAYEPRLVVGLGELSILNTDVASNYLETELVIYCFAPAPSNIAKDAAELVDRLMLTAYKVANRFTYTPHGGGQPIAATPAAFLTVDLSESAQLANKIACRALSLTLRLKL